VTTPASAPGDDGVHVRHAERADLLAVLRIEKRSFPQPWPFDAFERFLDEPGFLVADDGQHVVGYVVADVVPNHGRGLGHVKDIAVHPERRGEGIGRTLLGRSMGVLAAEGAGTIKLEVRESNETARRLYEDFGFRALRRIPRYYDDGEDAIVMLRDVNPP